MTQVTNVELELFTNALFVRGDDVPSDVFDLLPILVDVVATTRPDVNVGDDFAMLSDDAVAVLSSGVDAHETYAQIAHRLASI